MDLFDLDFVVVGDPDWGYVLKVIDWSLGIADPRWRTFKLTDIWAD